MNTPNSCLSVSARAPEPPTAVEVHDVYRRKYVGVDMAFKFMCYFLRFRRAWTTDPTQLKYLDTLILNIIDCRMLCNSMKHFGNAKAAYSAYVQAPPSVDTASRLLTAFTVGSFGFRAVEQVFGDLGYLQKNWMSNWNRPYISKRYKFFKWLGLMCCALLELVKLRRHIYRGTRKLVRRVAHAMSTSRSRRRSSVASPLPPPDAHLTNARETSSIATSPILFTPGSGGRSPDFPKGTEQADTVPPSPALLGHAHRQTWMEWSRDPTVRSVIFLIRNIADLLIYGQWMEAYKPYKTLEAVCGMVSGGLGVAVVWWDADAELTAVRSGTPVRSSGSV